MPPAWPEKSMLKVCSFNKPLLIENMCLKSFYKGDIMNRLWQSGLKIRAPALTGDFADIKVNVEKFIRVYP